jgi:hypothetical protein
MQPGGQHAFAASSFPLDQNRAIGRRHGFGLPGQNADRRAGPKERIDDFTRKA